jgi:hypothetical protein
MAEHSVELVATRAGPPVADLWLVRAASVADLADLVLTPDWHDHVDARGGFGLLLAWGGEAPDFAQVAALTRVLIEQGMFYFGAWGPGSARIEYAVDVTDVTVQMDASQGGEAPIVMTTSFGAVPIEAALFELWELAPRDEGKVAGPARVAVVLGRDTGALVTAVRASGRPTAT